ncbi:MAG: hypothetical protein ACXVFT_10860 [Solirubrobacteraceae bacterium]
MDAHLKRLADASMAAERAEQALGDGAPMTAADALDEARRELQGLRESWPSMTASERAVVGRAAVPVRERIDALVARLPKISALSEAAPEHDPEQDADPEAA